MDSGSEPDSTYELPEEGPKSSCCVVAGVALALILGCLVLGLAFVAFRYDVRRALSASYDTRLVLAVEGDEFDPEGVSDSLRKRFRAHKILADVRFDEGEIVVLISSLDRSLAEPILAGGVDFRVLAEVPQDALSAEARAAEIERIQTAQAAAKWDPLEDSYATYPWHPKAYGAGEAPLLLSTKDMLDDTHFKRFEESLDQNGLPALGFKTTTQGARRLEALSGANVGRRIAFVLDGQVRSAPMVRSAIGRRGIVEGGQGGFSKSEVARLVIQLESSNVPYRLRVVEETQISPKGKSR
jgi:SecD-like export protein